MSVWVCETKFPIKGECFCKCHYYKLTMIILEKRSLLLEDSKVVLVKKLKINKMPIHQKLKENTKKLESVTQTEGKRNYL